MKTIFKGKLPVICFFILFFLLGVLIFRDYGTTWDDYNARVIGQTTYDYITGTSDEMLTYVNRDYGPDFELFLVIAEKISGIKSPQQIIYLRHFLTFFLFFIGSIFLYKIAALRYSNRLLPLLGVLILILSPRIFADSFYNTKDMAPFVAMIIANYTMLWFLNKPNGRRAIIHALSCAFLVDVRLPGLFVIVLTASLFLLDIIRNRKKQPQFTHNAKVFGTYLGSFFILMILFWPFLWTNPAGHFLEAFSNMSRFTRWDDTVLYFGKFVKAVHELPWHYAPVWIAITTPIVYLLFFLVGIWIIIFRLIRHPLTFYSKYRDDLIYLIWFFLPLIFVIGLHSVIYDGWRHLYFIYPSLILISLVGIEGIVVWVNRFKKSKLLISGVMVSFVWINLSSVLTFMIFYHPYQNLYFNFLAGGMKNAKKNFDLDYWGLSFRKGLEYIAQNDKEQKIPVFFSHGFASNIDVLNDKDRKRFVVQDKPEGAKYILTNYRWHPQEYSESIQRVYEVTVSGERIMSVYKFY